MEDTTESYPPLRSSPPTPGVALPCSRREPPPYIRTSFSSGYVRSKVAPPVQAPIVTSPSTPGLRRHSQSRGRGHTKNFDAQTNPPPLPLPKYSIDENRASGGEESSDERVEKVVHQWKLKHNEAMAPCLLTRRMSIPVLPDNPKLWTPAQLAEYLLTALRFKSSKSNETIIVPKPVAQDIANFVIDYKLNGRVFVRLTRREIEELGVNKLWSAALLSSSMELRKSLLKGRIWGFGLDEDVISTQSVQEPEQRITTTLLEYEESLSSIFGDASTDHPPTWPRDSSEQPKAFLSRNSSVLSFESDSSSKSVTSPTSARSRALSTSSVASSGAGRVKDIIRKLERVQNSSSVKASQPNEASRLAADEMSSESEEDREADEDGSTSVIAREAEKPRHLGNQHIGFYAPPESVRVRPTASPLNSKFSADETTLIEPPPLFPSAADSPTIPQPAYSSIPLFRDYGEAKWATPKEEPTIEALLGERGIQDGCPLATSWGAEAWEIDFAGGTSRRIRADTPVAHGTSSPLRDNAPGDPNSAPQVSCDNISRGLDRGEHSSVTLEGQGEGGSHNQNDTEDHEGPKASASGGLSPITLPPYLLAIGFGICTLAAGLLMERMIGRRSRH